MNKIDLRRFDLNLLVVFEVLLVERSVTRAAERLARTQSAISHALSRLRVQLGDPVLVKGGKFMQPTPFALDFLEEVRPILARIQRALSPRHSFDPASSRRIFRLCAPDFALTLFTRLHARLRVEAPSVAIDWSGLRNSMLLDLVEGQIDVAIAPTPPRLTQDVFADGIGALQWRCFARKGHPAFLNGGRRHGRGGRTWSCGSEPKSRIRSTSRSPKPASSGQLPAGFRISLRSHQFWPPPIC